MKTTATVVVGLELCPTGGDLPLLLLDIGSGLKQFVSVQDGCFDAANYDATTSYETFGSVILNKTGLTIKAEGGKVVVQPSAGKIFAPAGKLLLKTQDGRTLDKRTSYDLKDLKRKVQLSAATNLKLGRLGVTEASLLLGGSGEATVTLQAKLPDPFSKSVETTVAASAVSSAKPPANTKLFSLDELPLGGSVIVRDISLFYRSPLQPPDLFTAGARVTLPEFGADFDAVDNYPDGAKIRGLRLTDEGHFKAAGLQYNGLIQAGPVGITSLGAAFSVDPVQITADVGAEIFGGVVSGAEVCVSLIFADPKHAGRDYPICDGDEDAKKTYADLVQTCRVLFNVAPKNCLFTLFGQVTEASLIEIASFKVPAGGGFSVALDGSGKVVGLLPVEFSAGFRSGKGLKFNAASRWDVLDQELVRFDARLSGKFASEDDWQLEVGARICADFLLDELCRGGDAVVSSRGLGGCIYPGLPYPDIGGWYRWGGSFGWDNLFLAGCSYSDVLKQVGASSALPSASERLRADAPVSSLAAQASSGVALKKGIPVVVGVEGTTPGSAPVVELVGPDGKVVIGVTHTPTKQAKVLRSDKVAGVWFFLDPPVTGTYQVVVREGSIKRVVVAEQLPKPRVVAKVTGSGSDAHGRVRGHDRSRPARATVRVRRRVGVRAGRGQVDDARLLHRRPAAARADGAQHREADVPPEPPRRRQAQDRRGHRGGRRPAPGPLRDRVVPRTAQAQAGAAQATAGTDREERVAGRAVDSGQGRWSAAAGDRARQWHARRRAAQGARQALRDAALHGDCRCQGKPRDVRPPELQPRQGHQDQGAPTQGPEGAAVEALTAGRSRRSEPPGRTGRPSPSASRGAAGSIAGVKRQTGVPLHRRSVIQPTSRFLRLTDRLGFARSPARDSLGCGYSRRSERPEEPMLRTRRNRPSRHPASLLAALIFVAAALGPAPASAVLVPGAAVQSATKKNPKSCKSSEVRRTIAYRTRGKRRSVTGCIPRSWSKSPTLRQGRAIVPKLAPKQIAKLLRGKAARRVSAADPVLDRAIAAAQLPLMLVVDPAFARAAAVGQGGDTQTLRSPPGTTTTQTRTGTEWSASEPNPGEDREVVVETKAKGSSKTSTYKLLQTMSRCPDAGGVGRGVIKLSMRETHTVDKPGGGYGVTDVLTTYDAEVLVRFNDGAAVESVEVKGNWSYENQTRSAPSRSARERRLTRHTVDGAVTGSTGADGRNSTVTTSVQNANNWGMAIYGQLVGAVANTIVDQVPGELVRDSAGRARSGACAKIVPDPLTAHVKPGGTVALTATLNDGAGAPLPGTVKAVTAQASTTPGVAQADTTARFTYNALPYSPPGRSDTVTLSHVSKRGLANDKTVTVIYDEPPALPQRFDGTWTRIVTSEGLTQTYEGTASYVKHPFFGPQNPGTEEASVPYIVESASMHWKVTGGSSGAGCTQTYTGEGTTVYSEAWNNGAHRGTHLDLQDIRRGAGAPASEPAPYNYAIAASGDTQDGPRYDINGSGNCAGHTTAPIDYRYLEIGTPTYDPNDPPSDPGRVERADSAVLLEGHRFTDEGFGNTYDDTWHFTGSG